MKRFLILETFYPFKFQQLRGCDKYTLPFKGYSPDIKRRLRKEYRDIREGIARIPYKNWRLHYEITRN